MIALEEKNMELIHNYLSKGWSYRKNWEQLIFSSPKGDETAIYSEDGELISEGYIWT
jgi:hypothetical protein